MITTKLFYTDLLGAPFKERGKSKEEGFDCWTLSQEIYKRLGWDLPHFTTTMDVKEADEEVKKGKEFLIELRKPEPYCLILFSIIRPYVSHIGVMLDKYRFIHITESIPVSVEKLNHPLWLERARGFWKLNGT